MMVTQHSPVVREAMNTAEQGISTQVKKLVPALVEFDDECLTPEQDCIERFDGIENGNQ